MSEREVYESETVTGAVGGWREREAVGGWSEREEYESETVTGAVGGWREREEEVVVSVQRKQGLNTEDLGMSCYQHCLVGKAVSEGIVVGKKK